MCKLYFKDSSALPILFWCCFYLSNTDSYLYFLQYLHTHLWNSGNSSVWLSIAMRGFRHSSLQSTAGSVKTLYTLIVRVYDLGVWCHFLRFELTFVLMFRTVHQTDWDYFYLSLFKAMMFSFVRLRSIIFFLLLQNRDLRLKFKLNFIKNGNLIYPL